MLWKDMRERTKEIHKELQDLDPMGSPHKEEKVIGRNIDLDLLSLFPQRYVRIMGGIERCASFPRSTMEEERRENVLAQGRRRGGVFIPPPIKMTVTASQAGLSGQNWPKIPRGRIIRPKVAKNPAPHLIDAHKSP
jgi:hypothetical protein